MYGRSFTMKHLRDSGLEAKTRLISDAADVEGVEESRLLTVEALNTGNLLYSSSGLAAIRFLGQVYESNPCIAFW